MLIYFRNSATQTVEQELLFVGQEAGKLLAVRDIVQKVKRMIICCDMIKVFAVVWWFFFPTYYSSWKERIEWQFVMPWQP